MSHKDKKKVLIIEDDASLANALRENLNHEGFVTFQAEDGEKGMAIALRERPDLILLDLVLPKLDGMNILADLRSDMWGKTVKVIILSNISDTKKVAEAMAYETFDYLVKSNVNIDMVVAMVKKNLGLTKEGKAP